jgi:hypothetical protein
VIPLRLGYIGLKLRTQQDIIDNKDIATALKEEEAFFTNHRAYRAFSERFTDAYSSINIFILLPSFLLLSSSSPSPSFSPSPQVRHGLPVRDAEPAAADAHPEPLPDHQQPDHEPPCAQ